VRPLFLSRFTIGVAQIAGSLSGGLILDDARDAVFLSLLTSFDFGSCGSICGCLTFGRLSLNPLLLIELQAFPLGSPFFPGQSYRHTLFLPCGPGRLSGFLCGTIGLEESGLCVGSGTAAIGEIIVSGVFQICTPFEVWSR
jgi:hypothetical protein